jgi:hypothetical protein
LQSSTAAQLAFHSTIPNTITNPRCTFFAQHGNGTGTGCDVTHDSEFSVIHVALPNSDANDHRRTTGTVSFVLVLEFLVSTPGQVLPLVAFAIAGAETTATRVVMYEGQSKVSGRFSPQYISHCVTVSSVAPRIHLPSITSKRRTASICLQRTDAFPGNLPLKLLEMVVLQRALLFLFDRVLCFSDSIRLTVVLSTAIDDGAKMMMLPLDTDSLRLAVGAGWATRAVADLVTAALAVSTGDASTATQRIISLFESETDPLSAFAAPNASRARSMPDGMEADGRAAAKPAQPRPVPVAHRWPEHSWATQPQQR